MVRDSGTGSSSFAVLGPGWHEWVVVLGPCCRSLVVELGPHRHSLVMVLGPGAWWYGPLFAIHRWWYWALAAVRAWWYWALITVHGWWCGALFAVRAWWCWVLIRHSWYWVLVIHVVLPLSFVDGVAGCSLHYSWVVVVGPSRTVCGWYWCPASVFVCHGAGGSSSWSYLSFEGEGCGSLFVFAGACHCSWVPVGGCCHLCPVRGGGWQRRSFAW